MAVVRPSAVLLALGCVGGVLVPQAAAQTLRGTVLDGSNARPVPLAGVYLLDRNREILDVAMADSLGRYVLAVPDSGEYVVFAERFGYFETQSPLLAIRGRGQYAVDLELRPEPFRLDPLDVTVGQEHDVILHHLTLELGGNPNQAFGFRILQGARLEEAKAKGRLEPTSTLRWLYVPVSHVGGCVRVNSLPLAVSVTSRGARVSQFVVGAVPSGTRSPEAALGTPVTAEQAFDEASRASSVGRCGTLYVDDRDIATDLLDTVDMTRIATIVVWPGTVRMYTYGYDFSQVGPPR